MADLILLEEERDRLWLPPPASCLVYYPGVPPIGGVLTDFSGNNVDGTIDGATWGRVDSGINYLSYDGGDDETTLTLNLDTYANWTVRFWTYLEYGASDSIWGHTSSYTVYYSGVGNLKFYWGADIADFADFTPDAWNCLTTIREGNNITLRTNGAEDDTGTTANTTATATLYLSSRGAGNFAKQKMALVSIQSAAMSGAEDTRRYNYEKRRFGV